MSLLRTGAAVLALSSLIGVAKATPYASCITNTGSGNIKFYLNEAGASVTITYEDGSTNANFNGITTSTNVPRGVTNFSLGAHTSYTISVNKVGNGKGALITSVAIPSNARGIDVNKRAASPFFGTIYGVSASFATGPIRLYNSDFSLISSNSGGVAWVSGSASSPYRIAINDDDYLTVGDFASAHSGVWRVDPTVTSNLQVLGPTGDTAGAAANSHGSEFSRCLLVGNLTAGANAVMYTVDAGSFPFNASKLNSILVYSNLSIVSPTGLTNGPRITAPDLLGPATCLNQVLNNNYPGITYGTNGYFYASGRRDGPSGGTANLQVYDANLNLLWNSLYNANVNDYFAQNGTGLADSAVSPDCKYVAGLGYGNNQMIVCSLTNGIPDVSTLYVITNTVSTTSAGRGLCWDAADNLYVSSSGGSTFQSWTLGLIATANTTGNASGSTGFSLVTPSTAITVTTSNALTGIGGSLFSQTNAYGNPTNAYFVLSRSGSLASPLTVVFTLTGTATNGTYTASATTNITFPAGVATNLVTITAVSDGIARATTTLTLNVQPNASGGYTFPLIGTSLTLLNTAPNKLIASPNVASMYNAFSNDYASFTITRLGDTNAAAYTVSSYTYGGTAVAGQDYTYPGSVTFNPGDLTQTNFIYPLTAGALPVDSSANPYVGNKTALISIGSGTGYTGSTNTALLNILDSAYPTTSVLFADPLTDPNDSTNWGVTSANNNMQTNAIDNTVVFGYDLQTGDPGDNGAIPLPPSGAATALRVTLNKSQFQGSGAAAGVNLYPTNVSFSGNYAVRFSMNIIEGDAASYTTEGPIFGINHSGQATNWWSGSGVSSGWGPTNNTTWEADGIWYWISPDGGAGAGDYLEFTGLGGALPNTGWTQIKSLTRASFLNAFKTNVFSSSAGPGLVGNNSVVNSNPATNWVDVEIKQINSIVTLSLDKTPVFVYTNTTTFTNGTVMLGYDDPFSSVGGLDGSVYYSNLRVVAVAVPSITQILVNPVGNVVINFTSNDGDLIASNFALQSAAAVAGPYADKTNATITQLSAGAFQAVVPVGGSSAFYRIRQK